MIQSALILDDSPLARFDLKTKINIIASPITIYEAANYEKAQKIMLLHKVDVVLVDLSMPQKNGMDFIIDFIREEEELKDIPVIVTTGVNDNSILRKALEGLVLCCLKKPIKVDLLKNAFSLVNERQPSSI